MINPQKIILFFLLFFALYNYSQQNNIENISIKNGLSSNTIYDIQQDEIGYLWLATSQGLVKYDGDNFTQISDQKTTSILIKNNKIYASLENGLLIIKNSKQQILASKKVLTIFSWKNAFYVGTTEGIYFLNKNTLQPLETETDLDFLIINDILQLDNSFFMATNKGLWLVDDLQNPTEIKNLIDDDFISLTSFGTQLIAATSKDTIHIIEDENEVHQFKTLANISVIKKLKNELWVTSTTNGLEVFSLPSFSFKQKVNKYNSLQTNTIYNVFKSDLNTLYIASNKGFYFFKDDASSTENKKPIVYLENLLVNHQNADSLLVNNKIQFSDVENNIAISFKTVDVLHPKKINYRYKLTDKFSPWSTNNTVQFANLNPGKYTFEVQSKINTLKSDIRSFSFTIDTPLYQKTWFILVIITFVLIVSYFSLDIYIKKIRALHKENVRKLKQQNYVLTLEQKALQLQMNPHFIFNVLNGIKALGNAGKKDELNMVISQFSVLLRGVLNNSRKEEISLQDEIILLKNYLELEQKMSAKTFDFSINTSLNNMDAEEILIPPMLLQPFIENSIKHGIQPTALNGKIEITFTVKKQFLNCSIIDNGIGIYESKKQKESTSHESLALEVSKERVQFLSKYSSFSIDEIKEDGKVLGTKVWLKIPLKTDY